MGSGLQQDRLPFDEVLREALELPEPETFLTQPSEALDWRIATLPESDEEPAPVQH